VVTILGILLPNVPKEALWPAAILLLLLAGWMNYRDEIVTILAL
jgi:hypothetical protein